MKVRKRCVQLLNAPLRMFTSSSLCCLVRWTANSCGLSEQDKELKETKRLRGNTELTQNPSTFRDIFCFTHWVRVRVSIGQDDVFTHHLLCRDLAASSKKMNNISMNLNIHYVTFSSIKCLLHCFRVRVRVLPFIARGSDINGCVLSYFEETVNLYRLYTDYFTL